MQRECVTCFVELLQNGLDLLLELLRGEDEAALKLLLVLLQHRVTVNQHTLEPNPLPIQILTHILHLWVKPSDDDDDDDEKECSECPFMCRYTVTMTTREDTTEIQTQM